MIKINNLFGLGDKVYIIQVSKKTHNSSRTIILLGRIVTIGVNEHGTMYEAKPVKCVNVKDLDITNYSYLHRFRNSDIDTGNFDSDNGYYPVFTDKEKCLRWLRR